MRLDALSYTLRGEFFDVPPVPVGPGETSLPITNISLAILVAQTLSNFSVTAIDQNGFSAGKMDGATVSSLGGIVVHDTNGVKKDAGQIALATFGKADRLGQFGTQGWTCRAQCVVPGLDVAMRIGTILSGNIERLN